jgi:hypothetical protein
MGRKRPGEPYGTYNRVGEHDIVEWYMGCCWRGDGGSEREERKYEVTEVAVARRAVSTSCCILEHTGNSTYSSRVLWVNVINDQGARRSQRRFFNARGRDGRKWTERPKIP